MPPLPGPWQFVLLALAGYRLTRLAGWDEFPLIEHIRAFVIGERWIAGPEVIRVPLKEGETLEDKVQVVAEQPPVTAEELGLPGKQPHSQVDDVRPSYARPTLAHLVHCPFCMGWWICLAVWGVWLAAGDWALLAATPFALSGTVGLLAKNLDA